MRTRSAIVLAGVLLAVTACGGGDDGGDGEDGAAQEPAAETGGETGGDTGAAAESEPITVELLEANASGISGTAILVPGESSTIKSFELSMELPGADALVAHVHNVTCERYAEIKGLDRQIATVYASLADVREGVSESTVPGKASEGGYSINVHKPASPFPVVACGNIPTS